MEIEGLWFLGQECGFAESLHDPLSGKGGRSQSLNVSPHLSLAHSMAPDCPASPWLQSSEGVEGWRMCQMRWLLLRHQLGPRSPAHHPVEDVLSQKLIVV